MSAPASETARGAAHGTRRWASRIARSWRSLRPSQRLAGYAAVAMFATMFLPWYSETVAGRIGTGESARFDAVSRGVSAWSAFSFVEAAVLLVAVGVLILLFHRGEGKAFHLPGGDGTVIAAGGVWASLLVFYRLLDQPENQTLEAGIATYGLRWGIFFALAACIFLASAGVRLRNAHLAEPPLPGTAPGPHRRERRRRPAPQDAVDPEREDLGVPTRVEPSLQPTRVDRTTQPTRVRRRPDRPPVEGGEQLSFDEDE